MNQENDQTTTVSLEDIERMKASAKANIELAEALERLYSNEDFKKVYLKHYLEEYPKRLVGLLAEPNFNLRGNKEAEREELMELMMGVSRFSYFNRTIFNRADQAHKELDSIHEAEVESRNQQH